MSHKHNLGIGTVCIISKKIFIVVVVVVIILFILKQERKKKHAPRQIIKHFPIHVE